MTNPAWITCTLAQNNLCEFWCGMHLTCKDNPIVPDRNGSVKRPEKESRSYHRHSHCWIQTAWSWHFPFDCRIVEKDMHTCTFEPNEKMATSGKHVLCLSSRMTWQEMGAGSLLSGKKEGKCCRRFRLHSRLKASKEEAQNSGQQFNQTTDRVRPEKKPAVSLYYY